MLSEVRQETERPFLVAKVILRFLSIFKKTQASSPFEALNPTCLSRYQRNVRHPVQMRRGPSTFYSAFTGNSDIPSSCEMKEQPAFKPLQLYSAFIRVRASQFPFQLREQIVAPSHIPISDGSLLLRCLCKVGIPLQSKPGNQLSSRDDISCMELSLNYCAEIGVPLDLRQVSQGIS